MNLSLPPSLALLLVLSRPSTATEPTACPAPPVNLATTEERHSEESMAGRSASGGEEHLSTANAARVSYTGQGLSQEAVDQAWKVYQLCLQAEKGLIPKEVYVAALRRFYGLDDPTAPATPVEAPTAANLPPSPAANPPKAGSCTIVEEAHRLDARMRGTIGEHEILSWAKTGNAGWIWSSKGLLDAAVRIRADGRLDVPGPLNMQAAGQSFSTLDPTNAITASLEGTLWGGAPVETDGLRVIGIEGQVMAIKGDSRQDLGPAFGGGAPAAVYHLPVTDQTGRRALLVSIDPGERSMDTLLRSWWLDPSCL